MLNWTEQTVKNCSTDNIVAVNDGVETYYADAHGLTAEEAKADYARQSDPDTDWSDVKVSFLTPSELRDMREACNQEYD